MDCESKRVTFKVGDDVDVLMVGECRDYLSNMTFALVAKKLIHKGCDSYLAYVHYSSDVGSIVEVICTIKDFQDVFPE